MKYLSLYTLALFFLQGSCVRRHDLDIEDKKFDYIFKPNESDSLLFSEAKRLNNGYYYDQRFFSYEEVLLLQECWKRRLQDYRSDTINIYNYYNELIINNQIETMFERIR